MEAAAGFSRPIFAGGGAPCRLTPKGSGVFSEDRCSMLKTVCRKDFRPPRRGLELKPPYAPMEALSVDEIPTGDEWQYEPKWDGFRCLAFRDGDKVELQSKSGQPLARYFPGMVAALL